MGKKTVRIEVDEEIWNEIKAEAATQGKTVKEFAGEIFEREVKGPEASIADRIKSTYNRAKKRFEDFMIWLGGMGLNQP